MFSTSTSTTAANSNTNNNKKRKANSDDNGDDGGSIQVGQAAAAAVKAVGPNDTAATSAEATTGNDTNNDTNTDTNNPSSQLSSLQSRTKEFIDTMKDSTQKADIREEKSEQRAIIANKRSERLETLLKKAVKTTGKLLKDQQVTFVAASVSSSSDEEGQQQQQQLPLNVDVDVDVDAETETETTTATTTGTTTTHTTAREEEATALALALSNNCRAEKANPENIVLNSTTWSTMLKQLQDDGYDIQPISSNSKNNDNDDDKEGEGNNYDENDNDDDDDEDNNTSNNNNNANSKYADSENANESKESLAAQGGRKRNKYCNWERNYQNLRYYRIRYGHCNVPQRSPKNQKNDKLGKWVSNMRSAYTAQKLTSKNITTKISKQQIDKLNSIGFHWSIKNYPEETINESWYSMYERLEQYKLLTGNINVVLDPSNVNPSQLAKWCLYQKKELLRLQQYKDTILTIDQIKLLYAIGMV